MSRSGLSRRFSCVSSCALLVALGGGCEAEVEGVPEGALARVGDSVLAPEDLAGLSRQLGAYARVRFRGPEGQRALLAALIDTEVLNQKAMAAGLGSDPRVHWAVTEEMATLFVNAELERRVPRAGVAEDEAALRAYYDAHPELYMEPELRSLEGVRFSDLAEAEVALEKCRSGEAQLVEFGEVVRTPLAVRDDRGFPGFHHILFAADLGEGEWLPYPVATERKFVAGRVGELQAARPSAYSASGVRERLIDAVREERLAPARAELMAELASEFPVVEG